MCTPVTEFTIRRHLRLQNTTTALWLTDLTLSNHNHPTHSLFETEYGTLQMDPLLAGLVYLHNSDHHTALKLFNIALQIDLDNAYLIPDAQYSQQYVSGEDDQVKEIYVHPKISPICHLCNQKMHHPSPLLPLSTAICTYCHDFTDLDTHPRRIQIVSLIIKTLSLLGLIDQIDVLLTEQNLSFDVLPSEALRILYTVEISRTKQNKTKICDILYSLLSLAPDNIELIYILAQQFEVDPISNANHDNMTAVFYSMLKQLGEKWSVLDKQRDALGRKRDMVFATMRKKQQQQQQNEKKYQNRNNNHNDDEHDDDFEQKLNDFQQDELRLEDDQFEAVTSLFVVNFQPQLTPEEQYQEHQQQYQRYQSYNDSDADKLVLLSSPDTQQPTTPTSANLYDHSSPTPKSATGRTLGWNSTPQGQLSSPNNNTSTTPTKFSPILRNIASRTSISSIGSCSGVVNTSSSSMTGFQNLFQRQHHAQNTHNNLNRNRTSLQSIQSNSSIPGNSIGTKSTERSSQDTTKHLISLTPTASDSKLSGTNKEKFDSSSFDQNPNHRKNKHYHGEPLKSDLAPPKSPTFTTDTTPTIDSRLKQDNNFNSQSADSHGCNLDRNNTISIDGENSANLANKRQRRAALEKSPTMTPSTTRPLSQQQQQQSQQQIPGIQVTTATTPVITTTTSHHHHEIEQTPFSPPDLSQQELTINWLTLNYSRQSCRLLLHIIKPIFEIFSSISKFDYTQALQLVKYHEYEAVMGQSPFDMDSDFRTLLSATNQPLTRSNEHPQNSISTLTSRELTLQLFHSTSVFTSSIIYANLHANLVSLNVKDPNYSFHILQSFYNNNYQHHGSQIPHSGPCTVPNSHPLIGLDYYAFFLYRLGKGSKLQALSNQLDNTHSTRVEPYVVKICHLLAQNNPTTAFQFINNLLAQRSNTLTCLGNGASLIPSLQHYQFGHFLKAYISSLLLSPLAIELYQHTRQLFGAHWLFCVSHYITCLASNNLYIEALNLTFDLHQRDQSNPRLLTMLGSVLLQASSALFAAEARQPQSANNREAITRAHEWETKARQALQEAVQIDPTNWIAVSMLAQLIKDQFQHENVVNMQFFDLGMSQNSFSPQLLPAVLRNTAKLQSAIDLLEKFLQHNCVISGVGLSNQQPPQQNIPHPRTATITISTPHHITHAQAHLLIGQLYTVLAHDERTYQTLTSTPLGRHQDMTQLASAHFFTAMQLDRDGDTTARGGLHGGNGHSASSTLVQARAELKRIANGMLLMDDDEDYGNVENGLDDDGLETEDIDQNGVGNGDGEGDQDGHYDVGSGADNEQDGGDMGEFGY